MPQPSRQQVVLYTVLALAVLVLGGRWLASAADGEGTKAEGASTSVPRAGDGGASAAGVIVSAPSRAVVVHVAGAVRRPGVYRLRRGDRVQDAVRRAGGASRKGDVNAVNLAAPVQDGLQVVVPARIAPAGAGVPPPGAVATPSSTAAAVPAPPVSLNTATAEQLDTLDGVGPATAAKILDYRREHGGFRTVEDLGQVPGIGPKKLAALRSKVRT